MNRLIEINSQNNDTVLKAHQLCSTFSIESKNPTAELAERFSLLLSVNGTWELTERYVQVTAQAYCLIMNYLVIQTCTFGVKSCFNMIPWRE